MIQTKRQINSDSDRIGGFGAESIVSPYADLVSYDEDFDIKAVDEAPVKAEPRLYTTLVGAEERVEEQKPQLTELPPHPKKAKVTLNNERLAEKESDDLRPTERTRAYGKDATAAEQRAAKRDRDRIDSRTKVLLCVYIAVALVLAIAVIATGVSISASSQEVNSLSESVSVKRLALDEMQSQLAEVRDDDHIRAEAQKNGMVEAGEPSYTFDKVADIDYPEATPRTNSFDSFCDWLSKMIN